MVNDAIDKNTDNEPVTPRKIPLDHTKHNTSDKLNSEMVQILISSKEMQELVTARFGLQNNQNDRLPILRTIWST